MSTLPHFAKTGKLKITRGSGNVFLDIGFSPEEAQNLQLRSELMSRIERFVKRGGMTQSEAARALGSRGSTPC